MKILISELSGIALDYAVVKAMGLIGADKFYSGGSDRLYVYGKEPPGGPQFGATESDFDIELTHLEYEKNGMFILKLITEENISVSPQFHRKTNDKVIGEHSFLAHSSVNDTIQPMNSQYGSTPALAVLRLFVLKQLGETEIEIPEVVYKEWKK